MKSVFALIATLIGCAADGGQSPSTSALELAVMDAPACKDQGGPSPTDIAYEIEGEWQIIVYVDVDSGQVTCVDSEAWSAGNPREALASDDPEEPLVAQNAQGETSQNDCTVCGKEPYPAMPTGER